MKNIERELKQKIKKKKENKNIYQKMITPKNISIASFFLSSSFLLSSYTRGKLKNKVFKSPMLYLTIFLGCNCMYDLYFSHFFMQKDKLINENIHIDVKKAKLENLDYEEEE